MVLKAPSIMQLDALIFERKRGKKKKKRKKKTD